MSLQLIGSRFVTSFSRSFGFMATRRFTTETETPEESVETPEETPSQESVETPTQESVDVQPEQVEAVVEEVEDTYNFLDNETG